MPGGIRWSSRIRSKGWAWTRSSACSPDVASSNRMPSSSSHSESMKRTSAWSSTTRTTGLVTSERVDIDVVDLEGAAGRGEPEGDGGHRAGQQRQQRRSDDHLGGWGPRVARGGRADGRPPGVARAVLPVDLDAQGGGGEAGAGAAREEAQGGVVDADTGRAGDRARPVGQREGLRVGRRVDVEALVAGHDGGTAAQ